MEAIPTRRELTAWMLALVLALSTVILINTNRADAGAAAGPTTEVVYIATGANFPDALGAAATAALGLGPVLLVQQNSIPAPTLLELNRLQPPRIVIVGGTAVVSDGVRLQLAGLGFNPTVSRIQGANRYETAANLSAASFPTSGMYPRAEHAAAQLFELGDGTPMTLVTVTIEAPAAGSLLIDANGDFSPGPGTIACWIEVNGTEIQHSARVAQIPAIIEADHELCGTQGGIAVPAGTHVITFVAEFPIQVGINRASINALWVPYNGVGAVPVP